MLRNLLIKIDFYNEILIGLIISAILIIIAIALSDINLFSILVFLIAATLACFSFTKYKKETRLWKQSIRYKDFDACEKLIGVECQVGQINKFLDIDSQLAYYDVYFKYYIIKNGEKTPEVGCIKISLDQDPEILLSNLFTFVKEENEIKVKSLDKEGFKKTHTRVMVYCFAGAVLHKKSINGYDYIHQAVKHEDLLFRK